MHGTAAIVSRPPTTRSRITNRSELLRGIDGRSAEARRYRDLVEGFVADFGSQKPGERELALIRQAAALTVQTEALQVKIVRGEDLDLEQLTRLTNVLTRTLKELGLRKRRAERPSLAAYLASINGGA
jgi:hypothetical protein